VSVSAVVMVGPERGEGIEHPEVRGDPPPITQYQSVRNTGMKSTLCRLCGQQAGVLLITVLQVQVPALVQVLNGSTSIGTRY
jgi:hypothetical protein